MGDDNSMDIAAICKTLSAEASQKPLVNRVYIFGSRVRGGHRLDSDLDVAVVVERLRVAG